MNIQINDCTIRDGGYLLNKDPDADYVSSVFKGLLQAGIDIIEIGFLQKKTNGESIVYKNASNALRHMPQKDIADRFAGFCDNSRYSIDLLEECGSGAFDYLKISFAKHESEEALSFVKKAKDKGYKVFTNPMDAMSYSIEERAAMIERVNEIKPYCFSIVDTFGTMYLDDLRSIFLHTNDNLAPEIRIGLHSHNNLQLSNALAEVMIELAVTADRDIVVDSSLYGMGRGAGNASTEVIAAFLNTKYGYKYGLSELFDVIDKHIAPKKNEVIWGYDLPMFTCGILGSHVDNLYHMHSLGSFSSQEQFDAISSLNSSQRKRYGIGYSKTDFSALDAAILNMREKME